MDSVTKEGIVEITNNIHTVPECLACSSDNFTVSFSVCACRSSSRQLASSSSRASSCTWKSRLAIATAICRSEFSSSIAFFASFICTWCLVNESACCAWQWTDGHHIVNVNINDLWSIRFIGVNCPTDEDEELTYFSKQWTCHRRHRKSCRNKTSRSLVVFVKSNGNKSPRLTRSGPTRCYLATLVAQLPAWSVFIKSEKKLQSVLNKTARYGILPDWSPKTIDELLESSDITLFKAALKNPDHVIHPLLSPPKPPSYNLRKCSHGLLLPTTQSNLLHKNFVYRMLLKTFISYYVLYIACCWTTVLWQCSH